MTNSEKLWQKTVATVIVSVVLYTDRVLVTRKRVVPLIGLERELVFTYSYPLSINNLLEQEAHLKLTEQLLVSCNEKIKVSFSRSTPQIQPGEMGILEWTLRLLLHQEFTVEYPLLRDISWLRCLSGLKVYTIHYSLG
ncbi:MAG: DUF4139 domain-containing protein [Rhizonema sp. PD38]|nr:DUF4139 domain-containing protein [Rhizonema sp. PD38]